VSDDTDSNVVHLPTRNGDSGGMPDAPDIGELFYSEPSDGGPDDGVPPESPEETNMGIPAIRAPISPEMALRETGLPSPPDSEDGESEDGEYVQRRSLADRLGDWLELRLEMVRDRHAGEATFREAEIARKTALLEARTASETAMIEQNGKLATAMTKARSDKAAARGKADADRTRASGSGLGADKGGRSKTNNSGGGSGGVGRGVGRGSGTNGLNSGAGRGPGGGNSPKSPGKGPDRPAGGRGNGAKGNESPGGPRGRQNGPGGSKGEGGRSRNSPADSRSDRSRARRERAAARQAAREQRRNTHHAADLADRSKDRDQREAARQERRAAKAERQAARKAKRDAAAAGRTPFGAAVADEAERRWDKRRKGPEKDRPGRDKRSEATTKKLSKDGPETAPDGPKATSATKEPKDGKKDATGPAGAFRKSEKTEGPGAESGADKRSFTDRVKDRFSKPETDAGTASGTQEPTGTSTGTGTAGGTTTGTVKPEAFGFTMDSPGRPSRPPEPEPEEPDIQDADIVDDPADPFGAYVTRSASLPRAPEPHTQRPGTSRPTTQEDQPVASEVNRTGPAPMAAKHRTDITFGEYLTEIVNIAIAAALHKDRAEELADALGAVANALRDMAADLVGDHNIATAVVNQITDLADAAMRMKQQADQCAIDCELASEAARTAAVAVGRTYSQDIQAMDDAGLAQASAAAHHD
jgi:hypothetical protein